jgi:hypothetical protein
VTEGDHIEESGSPMVVFGPNRHVKLPISLLTFDVDLQVIRTKSRAIDITRVADKSIYLSQLHARC